MFKNSTLSWVPCLSVAIVPRALYLRVGKQQDDHGRHGYLPERSTVVPLLEFHLLFQGKIQGFCTNIEHSADLVIDAMILQTRKGGVVNMTCSRVDVHFYLLPEA